MYREMQFPGGGSALLGVLALSFLIPGWVAGFLGLSEAHTAVVIWITGHEGIFLIALLLIYGAVGFCMLAAAAIGAYAAYIALMRGLATVNAWALHAAHAIAGLLGELVYWPVQLLRELVWDAIQQRIERFSLFLQQQYQLRCMYSEEYARDYPSFRAFERAYRAHQQGQQGADTDPLQAAIKLMGLPQRFTKEDVKRRFQELIVVHPDKVGPNGLATQLIDAYKLICSRKPWQ